MILHQNIHLNLDEKTHVNVARSQLTAHNRAPEGIADLEKRRRKKPQPFVLGEVDHFYTQHQCMASDGNNLRDLSYSNGAGWGWSQVGCHSKILTELVSLNTIA